MTEKTVIRTASANTFLMRYFQFGTGARQLVILPGLSVQSVMESADAVASAYEPLAKDFTVTVFDRRASLPEAYGIGDMARDTAEAMQALGLREVDLFGASQGGMIALEIALEHPELVRRLALGSAAARVGEAQYRVLAQWVKLAEQNDAAGLYLAFGEKLYPPAVFAQFRSALVAAAQTVTKAELQRFIMLAQGTKGFDAADRLNELQCPVLVLGAADDAVLGENAFRELVDGRTKEPLFESCLYEGFGHAAFDTAPDYKERLLQFFLK